MYCNIFAKPNKKEMMRNFESEAYILSRMMMNDDCTHQGLASLTDEDFTDNRHKAIFRAIQTAEDKGAGVDLIDICKIIRDGGGDVETLLYLQDLDASASYSGSSLNLYIADLKTCTQQRNLKLISEKIMGNLEKGELSPESIMEQVYHDMSNLSSKHGKKTRFTLDDAMKDFDGEGKDIIQVIQSRQEDYNKGIYRLKGIPTGFENLDDSIKGLVSGHFNIIGARTGVGKTTFCLNIMLSLIEKSLPVTFFSLEMTAYQVLTKLVAMKCYLNHNDFEDGKLNSYQFNTFTTELVSLCKKPLVIETRGSLSVGQVVNMIRQDSRTNGTKVFFIDYLGRLRGGQKFNSRQDEMHYISVRLAECAKDENVCIVCIAQLNRESVRGEKPRAPRDSDLADSGQIERDAVNILLLHRPEMFDKLDRPGVAVLKLAKQRFGVPGDLYFTFDGATGRFTPQKKFEDVHPEKKVQAQQEDDVDPAFDAFTPSAY
jgi:replicative DNA helicase